MHPSLESLDHGIFTVREGKKWSEWTDLVRVSVFACLRVPLEYLDLLQIASACLHGHFWELNFVFIVPHFLTLTAALKHVHQALATLYRLITDNLGKALIKLDQLLGLFSLQVFML